MLEKSTYYFSGSPEYNHREMECMPGNCLAKMSGKNNSLPNKLSI
jgi:hypothetical protein